jgi:predicted enzyme related to lactoylglutathione lyase
MIPIEGLFEAHISVRDFERSVAFYRDVVGLELGIAQPERPAAFFWVGGRGRSMMGIFSVGSKPLPKQHHVANRLSVDARRIRLL